MTYPVGTVWQVVRALVRGLRPWALLAGALAVFANLIMPVDRLPAGEFARGVFTAFAGLLILMVPFGTLMTAIEATRRGASLRDIVLASVWMTLLVAVLATVLRMGAAGWKRTTHIGP